MLAGEQEGRVWAGCGTNFQVFRSVEEGSKRVINGTSNPGTSRARPLPCGVGGLSIVLATKVRVPGAR